MLHCIRKRAQGADGRRETGDGRREMGDGRWETRENVGHVAPAACSAGRWRHSGAT
jgi:hypothetical protein